MSTLVKQKLKIEGMHCTACAMNIDFDLEDLDGVQTVSTNYAKQTSEVEYDPEKISLPSILAQIKKQMSKKLKVQIFSCLFLV